MDSNTKHSTAVTAIDSSVTSLAASGLLEMNPSTGPINRVPNEMMQLIMVKLGLDGDVKKLIRLRLVSTKWRSVVEEYCRMKKSLFVHFHPYQAVSSDFTLYFEKTFFGFVFFKNFSCLFLRTKIPSECLSSLLNMFPNIEQLSIDYDYDYEGTLDNSLQVYIKSLDSLKLVNLNGLTKAPQLSPALSKLEHFSCDPLSSELIDIHIDDILRFIPHLVPSCVRVNFGHNVSFVYDQVGQWHINNPLWLANLTHLRICIYGEEGARVVHLLSEHTILLQYLDFTTTFYLFKLTPTVLEDLAKLTHLSNLTFRYFKMRFSELGRAASQHRLTSLSSVLTCKLWARIDDDILDYSFSGKNFTRVLSVIFPNLAQLDLAFEMVKPTRGNELRHKMERHLGHFSNLSKHKISCFNLAL